MRIQNPTTRGLSGYGAITLTESAADAVVSLADIFSSPAYQDGLGYGVELVGAVAHGLVAVGTSIGALSATDNNAVNHACVKVGTSMVKTVGYSAGAAGAPLVGGLLVGAGVLGDLVTLFMN